jgi:hypothetical protein
MQNAKQEMHNSKWIGADLSVLHFALHVLHFAFSPSSLLGVLGVLGVLAAPLFFLCVLGVPAVNLLPHSR